MLVETDFCYPSGKGTSMYSRKGVSTIAEHLCFRNDNKEIMELIRRRLKDNEEEKKFKSIKQIKDYLE